MQYFYLALKNIITEKKRSLIFISTLFLSLILLVYGLGGANGISGSLKNKFYNNTSRDVIVYWDSVNQYQDDDPSRYYFSEFKYENRDENEKSVQYLDEYLDQNKKMISSVFNTSNSYITLDNGGYSQFSIIQGLEKKDMEELVRLKIIDLIAGKLPGKKEILISYDTAKELRLHLGDRIIIDSPTYYGYGNSVQYTVSGVFYNYSEYDKIFCYADFKTTQSLFFWDPPFFSTKKITLNKSVDPEFFSEKLNGFLREKQTKLHSSSLNQAFLFYANISVMVKNLIIVINFITLLIIAAGMNSSIQLSIYNRSRQFGTMRSYGYSSAKLTLIIFLENLILSLISLSIVIAVFYLSLPVINNTGIFLGKNALAYSLGTDRLYFSLSFKDIAAFLFIILIFNFIVIIKPSWKLAGKKITELLNTF